MAEEPEYRNPWGESDPLYNIVQRGLAKTEGGSTKDSKASGGGGGAAMREAIRDKV